MALKRIGPDVVLGFDGTVDHRIPLVFDAKSITVSDPADFARCHVVLSRNCENGGKAVGRNGNDGAGAAFAEEREFGGSWVVDSGRSA